MEKTGIIVCGSKGRMGNAIISVLSDYSDLLFIGGVDSNYAADEVTVLPFKDLTELETNKVSAGQHYRNTLSVTFYRF